MSIHRVQIEVNLEADSHDDAVKKMQAWLGKGQVIGSLPNGTEEICVCAEVKECYDCSIA